MNTLLKQVKFVKIYDNTLGLTPSGTIYKAIHADTTESLIVKVISKDRTAKDDQFLSNLKKEYFLIQTLKSSNVFRYFDFLETASSYYLVCHHTIGPSLEEFMNDKHPLNEATILTYFLQILNGYSEFFKLNIPHMNLSPSTIHFDITDKTLKLTPFFLAKTGQLKKHCSQLTAYMSPEFISNPDCIFHYKNDIWSLGALLFFITFKNSPFKGDNVKELIFNMELLLKDVVSYNIKNDNRKFSEDFKGFMEGFFHKNPNFRFEPENMIIHPCLLKQKNLFEKYMIKKITSMHLKMKSEDNKQNSELTKLLSSFHDNNELIFKDKNLKVLASIDNEVGQACNYIKLYNECVSIYQGNWIEKSTSPKLAQPNSASTNNRSGSFTSGMGYKPDGGKTFTKAKLLQRGATIGDIGDIPVIDEEDENDMNTSPNLKFLKGPDLMQKNKNPKNTKPHILTKAKTMQSLDPLLGKLEPELDNFDLTEQQALKSIIPKYYNEMDYYNFLFEVFLELKDMEKDFKEDCLFVRFGIIKYIYFRYQMFEKKVLEKTNIFSLSFWLESLQNSKDYLKIMEIIPQKQDKVKWNQIYEDLGEQIDKCMDDLYQKGELTKFPANEKHFLERESLLHVILFYANDFQKAIHEIYFRLLKKIRDKDEDLKTIKGKLNPKFFRSGLIILKILEINKMVGFNKFDKKMKHCFKDIRESLDELNSEKIETLFRQGLEGLLKAMTLKTKK